MSLGSQIEGSLDSIVGAPKWTEPETEYREKLFKKCLKRTWEMYFKIIPSSFTSKNLKVIFVKERHTTIKYLILSLFWMENVWYLWIPPAYPHSFVYLFIM